MRQGLEWLYDDGDDAYGDSIARTEVEPPMRIGVELPAMVMVPAHPRPGDGGVAIELSAEVTGEPVAIAFSTVELLIERLGRYQPWIMVPSATLVRWLGTSAISIVLNPLAKTCRTQWTSERLYDMELFQQGMEISEPIRGDIRA